MPTVAMGHVSVTLAILETTVLKVGGGVFRISLNCLRILLQNISSYEYFHAVDSEVLPWTKCGDYFCFNGGTCQNDTCQCREGFSGDYCLYSGECTRWTHLLCTQCRITCILCSTLQMCMCCSSLVMSADCANSTDNGG